MKKIMFGSPGNSYNIFQKKADILTRKSYTGIRFCKEFANQE